VVKLATERVSLTRQFALKVSTDRSAIEADRLARLRVNALRAGPCPGAPFVARVFWYDPALVQARKIRSPAVNFDRRERAMHQQRGIAREAVAVGNLALGLMRAA
jgi:hypothetical protein